MKRPSSQSHLPLPAHTGRSSFPHEEMVAIREKRLCQHWFKASRGGLWIVWDLNPIQFEGRILSEKWSVSNLRRGLDWIVIMPTLGWGQYTSSYQEAMED